LDFVYAIKVAKASLNRWAVADAHEATTDRKSYPTLILDCYLGQGEIFGRDVVIMAVLCREVTEAKVAILSFNVVFKLWSRFKGLGNRWNFALPKAAENGLLTGGTAPCG
jgi:hypothetical protein